MGYYNPAFKIKIVNPSDTMQQPESSHRENPADDFLDNLVIGQKIVAIVGKRKDKGKIARIFKNTENEGVYVQLVTADGKKYKVDGSRISLNPRGDTGDDQSREDLEKVTSSPAFFAESRILSFDEFCKLEP